MSIVSLGQHLAARSGDGNGATRRQLEVAAEQFEALFLQQILKQMRKASDVLGAGNSMRSRELDTLRDFHDETLAETLAARKQTGIADLLVRQLSGQAGDDLGGAEQARVSDLPPRAVMSLARPLISAWQQGAERGEALREQGSASFQRLIDKVIDRESGGQVGAISRKGARGLMQLMPDTAREVAASLGLAYDEARLTNDAAYNKRLGTTYLGQMLERYSGHRALALAAYNAGPGKVDEWLQMHGDPRSGGVSTGEWIERIPYAETRDYTRSILGVSAPPIRQATPLGPLSGQTQAQLASADAVRDGALLGAATLGVRISSDEAVRQNGFKSPPATVALHERDRNVAAGDVHRSRSAAFAQPIRIERKEIDQ
jgi:soluble lytic murein transglycosylase